MTRFIASMLLLLVLVTLVFWREIDRYSIRHCSSNSRIDALNVAIESRDAAALHDLLQDPTIDLNARDEHHFSPLIHAVACGSTTAVQLLLDRGADPNLGDRLGYTPLLYVVQHQPSASGEIADALLRHGADVNRRGSCGQTPLQHAVQMGRADLVEKFIAAGAKVNVADDQGTTALHVAACVDEPEIVGLLLSAGADPQAMDHHGDRPVDLARQCGAGGAIKHLQNAVKIRRKDE